MIRSTSRFKTLLANFYNTNIDIQTISINNITQQKTYVNRYTSIKAILRVKKDAVMYSSTDNILIPTHTIKIELIYDVTPNDYIDINGTKYIITNIYKANTEGYQVIDIREASK